MLTSSALRLGVSTAITSEEEIGYVPVHLIINLLHTTLLAVEMEVCPREVACGRASRDTASELAANNGTAKHGG